jgi:hypothetical protein
VLQIDDEVVRARGIPVQVVEGLDPPPTVLLDLVDVAAGFLAIQAACVFYQAHQDKYDALFVFTTIPQNFITNVQQGWPVKQQTKGTGRDVFWDQTPAFCSSGRLRQAVKMGDLAVMPDNTDALYTGIPFYPLSGIQLMAHEFGHQWLAAVRFDKGDGKGPHCRLRGFEPTGEPAAGTCDGYQDGDYNQHWSYYYNSGSVMYGSTIVDLGGGRFKLTCDNPKYSALDQYLMGLRDPSEVPPQFLVDVGDVASSGGASVPVFPGQSVEETGTRMDFTVQDVIRAEGPRQPASEPCHWTAAIVIVHAAGKPPTAAEIAKVEKYRTRWETFYAWATDGRGSFDTTLDNRGQPTCSGSQLPDAGPPRDLMAGRDAVRPDGGVPDQRLDRPVDEVGPGPDAGRAGPGGSGGCACSPVGHPRDRAGALLMLVAITSCLALRRSWRGRQ